MTLPQLTIKELLLWLSGFRKRARVAGHSMSPLLRERDVVLYKKTSHILVGDVVVVQHPFKSIRVVKKIARVSNKTYFVRGLSHSSEDSRSFGTVPQTAIRGRVTAALR
jgi:nickel-type superoxide dismutase maturation protease